MKVTLIKVFKNHQIGEVFEVSPGIANMLRDRGCIPDPRPLFFTPNVIEAAEKVESEKPSKKKSKEKDKDKEPGGS